MANQAVTIPVGKASDLQINTDVPCSLAVVSSNPAVATVSKLGIQFGLYSVRGQADGTTVITRTASTSGGSLVESDTVTVVTAPPTTMTAVYSAPA